ncbi:hypothetical protein GALMADRAFT_76765 [Galerina marginata CBS 339.88]|uniref:Tc1-like transposase DDE domain-containing protein n=1 Tax=Galerina marginata (strain CBS 339.88) TaxID=685588 RepID=A0A067STF2_GALM3|nr:hypothetical protein GALMADRAFT_76765 [Galerina marginata CBS 339.88]
MGYRKISSDMKECSLRLWEAGWSTDDICSALCVSTASLYRWRDILDTYGSVQRPPGPLRGRPRLIGLLAMTAIKEIFSRHPDLYLDELQWFLAIHHDLAISKSALQENLESAGLTRKVLHVIASERDEAQRQAFLHSIQNDFSGTADEFEADITAPFIRGQRYSMIAAMSKQGYLAAHVVPGSVDSFGFFDFIVEDVIPKMKPFPDAHSVLVMDNCRIHHTDTLQDVLNDARMYFPVLQSQMILTHYRHYAFISPSLLSRSKPN